MKFLLKNTGIILLIIGVILLAVPFFLHISTNKSLAAGLGLIICGFIAHIIINKKIRS